MPTSSAAGMRRSGGRDGTRQNRSALADARVPALAIVQRRAGRATVIRVLRRISTLDSVASSAGRRCGNRRLLAADLVDRLLRYRAPILVGGADIAGHRLD